jgi:hypothetical protein
MKTLNKNITSTFFNNPSDYAILIKRWSDIVNSPHGKFLTSRDHLYYLVLRGKNWHKAFLPGRKMQDYNCPQGYWNARCGYYYGNVFKEHFQDILVKGWEAKIKSILPNHYKFDYSEPYSDDAAEKLVVQKIIDEANSESTVLNTTFVSENKNMFKKVINIMRGK